MKKETLDQSGQSIMEYVILTGLIGLLAMAVVKQFGSTLKTKIQQSTDAINKTITIN
ncbi:MAG: Flp family type IVb pilin [Bacteriovoracaceae bacterium]|nr:Flp family type IVb pilin [Bacteriovoracaceae bacterium]